MYTFSDRKLPTILGSISPGDISTEMNRRFIPINLLTRTVTILLKDRHYFLDVQGGDLAINYKVNNIYKVSNLGIVREILTPVIRPSISAFANILESRSKRRVNKVGDIGSPWRIPLSAVKKNQRRIHLTGLRIFSSA